jgi:hypothetical protein
MVVAKAELVQADEAMVTVLENLAMQVPEAVVVQVVQVVAVKLAEPVVQDL